MFYPPDIHLGQIVLLGANLHISALHLFLILIPCNITHSKKDLHETASLRSELWIHLLHLTYFHM